MSHVVVVVDDDDDDDDDDHDDDDCVIMHFIYDPENLEIKDDPELESGCAAGR